MEFIFSKLPIDLVKNILLFDDHFIMRKGNIVSIIPKNDNRYSLLKFITLKIGYIHNFNNNTKRYGYYFNNLYDYAERLNNNMDLFEITITEKKTT